MRDSGIRGTVVKTSSSPRTNVVETNDSSIHRNRCDLTPTIEPLATTVDDDEVNPENCVLDKDATHGEASRPEKLSACSNSNAPPVEVRTRSGRLSKPPHRLNL